MTPTGDVGSTVSVLLQGVALSAATAMGANAVFTQLVTHTPHCTVVEIFGVITDKAEDE